MIHHTITFTTDQQPSQKAWDDLVLAIIDSDGIDGQDLDFQEESS